MPAENKETKATQKMIDLVIRESQDKKAEDLRLYTIRQPWLADCVLLMSVGSSTHLQALASELKAKIKASVSTEQQQEFFDVPRVCGTTASGWLVIDLHFVIVHILQRDVRERYTLDSFFEQIGTVHNF